MGRICFEAVDRHNLKVQSSHGGCTHLVFGRTVLSSGSASLEHRPPLLLSLFASPDVALACCNVEDVAAVVHLAINLWLASINVSDVVYLLLLLWTGTRIASCVLYGCCVMSALFPVASMTSRRYYFCCRMVA